MEEFHQKSTDSLISEMATDIKYIKKITEVNTHKISELEKWKFKWEGFKWAWALIFTTIGFAIQAGLDWLLSRF